MDNFYNIEAIGNVKPALSMIVLQIIYAVVNIMLKLAADDGMSLSVLNAYRFIFASVFIVPMALIFERKSLLHLTGQVLLQGFLCGFFGGCLLQNLYVKSLALTTAVFVSAMLNLIPAVTYILSVSLRLEESNLGKPSGKAKLLGTLTGIGGAMILTFYKGKKLCFWSTKIQLLQHAKASPDGVSRDSLIWGCMIGFGAALSYSLWLIVQVKVIIPFNNFDFGHFIRMCYNLNILDILVLCSYCHILQKKMSQKFPWHYSIAALTSVTASIQSVIFALCTEKDWSQWKLGWNVRLLTAASAGILASGVCYTLLAWCVHRKGPLFASAFSPLMLVVVTLSGPLVLDECLSIGSLLGSVLIVGGLYMLLWGKSKETQRKQSEMVSSKDSIQCEPMNITNRSLACNQKEHDKKIVTTTYTSIGVCHDGTHSNQPSKEFE